MTSNLSAYLKESIQSVILCHCAQHSEHGQEKEKQKVWGEKEKVIAKNGKGCKMIINAFRS